MAERPQLSAEPRTIRGKQVSRLRKQGIAPGVVYGPPLDVPRPISVETQALERIFYAHGTSALLDLSIDGVSYPVFIRSLQREPIRHQVLSVEFYAPPMNQAVVGTVPILATGELSSRVDGILTHTRESVDVRGLPDQIPTHFEVDVSQLDEVDAAILVSDLTLPPGIEMLTPAEEILIKVAAPSRVAEPAAAAEEALAEQTGDMPQEATEGIPPVEEPGA